MRRLTLAELDARCQKLGHREIGNWMARRVARPAALRVTWLVAPWPISAHGATACAWLAAVGGTMAFAYGTPLSWLIGALFLQAWYLLDHVDGQLARLHRTESLDGVALDYLMHHAVHLIVPLGIGCGIAFLHDAPGWLFAGVVWALAGCLLGLLNDVRYKAFIQRLKRVEGELVVAGGGGGRPAPATPWPRHPRAVIARLLRLMCEMHVMLNVLSLLSLLAWVTGDATLLAGRVYLVLMAVVSSAVFITVLVRSIQHESAEREFAAWFQPPHDAELVCEGHWWKVQAASCDRADDTPSRSTDATAIRSS